MGSFSWIIIVIVLIQVIAGAVAKTAEKRKAMEKAKEFRKEALEKPSLGAGRTQPTGSLEKGALALENLRKQRIEKLRKRSAPTSLSSAPSPSPVPRPPVAAEMPSFVVRDEAVPTSRPAKIVNKKQPKPAPTSSVAAATKAKKPGAANAAHAADLHKDSLLGSDAVLKSEIFENPINANQVGTELARTVVSSHNAEALMHLLESPERIRHGLLLAEILQPPVSMRPEGCGGWS